MQYQERSLVSLDRVSSFSQDHISIRFFNTLTVELLSLQNATAFEYTSPAPIQPTGNVQNNFQSSRFYFLNLQTNGNENFGLEATSTADISLSIAGLGNCPTYQFSNESPYWSGSVSANQSAQQKLILLFLILIYLFYA